MFESISQVTIPNENLTEVIGVRECAELLGLNPKSVYEAVKRKEIPFRRVGKKILFSRTAVLDWLRG